MSQLTPCPDCQRHVRKTETRCPFCGQAISLAHLPAPALPRRRLGRAATFAFGASVVGATSLVACSDDDAGAPVAIYGGPPVAGAPSGGSPDDYVAGAGTAVYGAPAGGMGNEDTGGNGGTSPVAVGGQAGAAGAADAGGAGGTTSTEGGAAPLYGGPPGGAGSI